MAKNITIREGDTSKQFTAKKLKMNLVGGGTTNFIPEDEALDYVDIKDHEFKENGTFNPSDFNADAFGQVKISIPANVKEKTFTKNGTFNASADNVLGYSKVTIAVPGGGGGGPYTVRFFDSENNIIKTDANVPYDGRVSCTILDGTVKDGQYFIGWNPAPEKVRGDMNCYPTYGDYIIDPTDIQDSWETICADGGAHYPILAKKPLIINIYNDEYMNEYNSFDGISKGAKFIRASNQLKSLWAPNYFLINSDPDYHYVIAKVQCHMIKVAEGEDGSHSTWISTGMAHLIPYDGRMLRGQLNGTGIRNSLMTTYPQISSYPNESLSVDYGDSAIRYFLETILFRKLPTALKENIKAVHKSYKGVANESVQPKTPLDKEVLATVWALSRKELHTFIDNNLSVSGAWDEEINGIDYSLQYMPNYNTAYAGAKTYLRSMFNFTSTNGWTNSLSCMNFNNLKLENTQEINDDTRYLYVPFGFCL